MPTLAELNEMANMVYPQSSGRPGRGPYFDISDERRADVMKMAIAAKQADALQLISGSI